MTYKITLSGQGRQNVERITGPSRSETVAVVRNSCKGWIAYKAENDAAEEHRFETPGAGVNVSRLINQHNGAELIARALGL